MQVLLLPFTPRYVVLTLAWLLTFAFAATIGGIDDLGLGRSPRV